MLRGRILALTLLALSACTGCNSVRNFEQWKCDRYGMCHFGITPSAPSVPPAAVVTAPPDVAVAPQCSNASCDYPATHHITP